MREYWNSLSLEEREALAEILGSSTGYLRLVFAGHKKAGFSLAQAIEQHTDGEVTKNQLRPDIYPTHCAR